MQFPRAFFSAVLVVVLTCILVVGVPSSVSPSPRLVWCFAHNRQPREIKMSRGASAGSGSANKAPATAGGGGGSGGGGGGDGDLRGGASPWGGGYSMFGPLFPAFHTLDNLYAEMMDNVERVQAELHRLYYPPFGVRPFHALGPAGGVAATAPALRPPPPGEYPLAVAGGGGARGGVGVGGSLMPFYRGGAADMMSPFYFPPASSVMMPAPFSRGVTAVAPRVDFLDAGDEYLMKADVPGVDKSNVKIQVHNGVMHITGEQQQESKEERKGFFMQERHQTSFSRSVPLPENVREDDIRATMKDGVLEIHLPKLHVEKANIKKIHVE